MLEPLDDRTRLSADEDDAPRSWRRANIPESTFLRNALICLVVTCAIGYGIVYFNGPATPVPAQRPVASTPEAFKQPIAPRPEASLNIEQRPQALADCMGPDNVIDEAVATCRFGKLPKPVHDLQAQGMVSARYMQRYKTEREQASRRQQATQALEFATVWQWDRKRSYRAEWLVAENRINGSSVCRNWRAGSIEYRECRKGAKVHFREQCRKQSSSAAARQRYCSAEGSFNPL
jgi:hypothetical protein